MPICGAWRRKSTPSCRVRHDLCARYGALGASQSAKGDEVDARDNYRKAVEFCRETASRYVSDVQSQLDLARQLFRASKAQSVAEAVPSLREVLGILENLDHAGALPKANASWAPFVRGRIAALENSSVSK
jgi:hypothetical protein